MSDFGNGSNVGIGVGLISVLTFNAAAPDSGPAHGDSLLMETGDYLLLESGDTILLE